MSMSGRCYSDSDRIVHFRANRSTGLEGEHRFVEVRYDGDSDPLAGDRRTIDEICTPTVHLEGMDQDVVWMDVAGVHVWFRAVRVKGDRRPHLVVTCYPSDARPYVVKPGEGTLERHYAVQAAGTDEATPCSD